jgi:hypothetical protein
MDYIRRGITVGALLVLGATNTGCLNLGGGITCLANECVGGLAWTAATEDGQPLLAGEYSLQVELEGDDRFTIACSVADDGTAECDEPVQADGDRDFRVGVAWFGEHTVHTDGMGTTVTTHGIAVTAREQVDGGVRGPTTAVLTLSRDGAVVLEDEYSLEYERDEEYHGDERCGFCDLSEERETTWMQ